MIENNRRYKISAKYSILQIKIYKSCFHFGFYIPLQIKAMSYKNTLSKILPNLDVNVDCTCCPCMY